MEDSGRGKFSKQKKKRRRDFLINKIFFTPILVGSFIYRTVLYPDPSLSSLGFHQKISGDLRMMNPPENFQWASQWEVLMKTQVEWKKRSKNAKKNRFWNLIFIRFWIYSTYRFFLVPLKTSAFLGVAQKIVSKNKRVFFNDNLVSEHPSTNNR